MYVCLCVFFCYIYKLNEILQKILTPFPNLCPLWAMHVDLEPFWKLTKFVFLLSFVKKFTYKGNAAKKKGRSNKENVAKT